MQEQIAIHWFRRDLRLHDNVALSAASSSGLPVLPIFIFDVDILEELEQDDHRVTFIHDTLCDIHHTLNDQGGGVATYHGRPKEVWKHLLEKYHIAEVHFNKDYEPYARQRDDEIIALLEGAGVLVRDHKDHVIFEEDEILKSDGTPYTVFTPYSKQWIPKYEEKFPEPLPEVKGSWLNHETPFLSLEEIGFHRSTIQPPQLNMDEIDNYGEIRNIPSIPTTQLSTYLRFGLIGSREIFKKVWSVPSLRNELIWREFFMQIIWHFPESCISNFKPQYNGVKWQNNEEHFDRWCAGTTGYPMVDAGMRQLNETGYMHNRVRMVAASFLVKHLLIDWRWGEAYFAKKLFDFELALNVGNWQWAAGTGCDAAPYFRVFNPESQQVKFDPNFEYIKRWVPEYGTSAYPDPIVDHKAARERAIEAYKTGLAISVA